jgi:beta-lactamase class D
MLRLILVLMLLGRATPPTVRAGECVVVARLDGDLLAVGGNECERRTLPASTFKIPQTGNGTVDGERASWLVGEIDSGGHEYVFASRARSSARTLGTTAGADLAVRILNRMTPSTLRAPAP